MERYKLGPGHRLTCLGQRNEHAREWTTPSGALIRVVPAVRQEELIAAYRSCRLLLFPTRLEGFGYVVAEAMACRKPVVATDCSSIPELIDHMKGGVLCPIDNVGAFADGIRLILANPQLARDMGVYNREKAERVFSIDRMVKQYIDVYRTLSMDA